MLDDGTRNRLRLWLASERSLGLSSVGPGDFRSILAAPTVAETRIAPRVTRSTDVASPAAPARQIALPQNQTQPAVAELPEAQHVFANASEPFTSPILSSEARRARLAALEETEVRGCVKCQLCTTRSQTVFGEGSVDAKLMFIGEGPGFKEDQTGRPFVGPAGELLSRMIGAMGLSREEVYIANVVKCRAFLPGPPAKDRAPALEEIAACSAYLEQQVETIRPRVIVTLGVPATQFVLQTKSPMSRLRGQWNSWHGIRVMPTWHPSYLLRREKEGDVQPKRQAWTDLQMVMKELGLVSAKNTE